MGNDLIQQISPELQKLDDLILKGDYTASNDIYLKICKKLNDLKKEEIIQNIENYLLDYHCEKNKFKFQTLISNLKPQHKIPFLLELIYENKLVQSISTIQQKDSDNIVIKKRSEKYQANNIENIKNEIELKMKKILTINKYIRFKGFQSIMFEMMAEKYFNLGMSNYDVFNNKREQSSIELQDIIDLFGECINNYKETEAINKNKKLRYYEDCLLKVEAHRNILIAKEKIDEEKFMEALEYFNKVNYNNSAMIEEKNKGIYICYDKLASIEEDKENYEKAIEYYEKINKNSKVFELYILINEKKIIECIKAKQYNNEIFNYFSNIFKYFDKAKNSDILQFKYSEVSIMLIELVIKLSLTSYQNNGLDEYINTLKKLKEKIEYKDIESMVDSLILELENLIKIDNINSFNFIKTKLLEKESSEINQRFYLSFFIMKHLNENSEEALLILLNPEIHLSYLNNESFAYIKNYLNKTTNINNLFLISKILYKIIVVLNRFNNIKTLNCISSKIIEISKNANFKNDTRNYDIIRYLILCFQEILINDEKINLYEKLKNIFFAIILKNNNYINDISRGLLFLSKKNVIFEKKILNILRDFLLKNKDGNLLQVLLIQYQNQKNIDIENIEAIYQMLLYYQENNQDLKVGQIFNFLLEMPEEIITCKSSIKNLEKYLNEMEIHPLVYKLIKKIPMKNRGIILSEKLYDYENNKDSNKNFEFNNKNLKNELNFKVTIEKEELAKIENNLNDQEIVEKLIYFLKHQKNLFKYLNVEKISKFYSLSNKELFNLLIDYRIEFNENSLINILQGFYRNNQTEIVETFGIFKKIREYQNKFSEIIESNLKTEQFLFEKKYEKIKSFDPILNEIFNDFRFLSGFANQHKAFISYILNMENNNKKENISKKIFEFLLIKKKYDIGIEIFKEIINLISEEQIINDTPKILINRDIPYSIKQFALFNLYKLMKVKKKNLLNILKTFKLFIDWIKIPDNLIRYLIGLVKSEKDSEIYDEIIYFLGNYFSIKKVKQEIYFNELNSLVNKRDNYQCIIKVIKTIKEKNEIFYLFSSLNYINFSLANNMNEETIIKMPTTIIINYIKEHNKNIDKNLLMENIRFLNDYWKFEDFSPIRDKTLRKLLFNDEKNSLNNLKLICC